MSISPRSVVVDASSIEQNLVLLQQRIDQMQATLNQQQKLATLGMVTSVIAHEFNNILTPMINYTRYALSDKSDAALREKALQKALNGAERAAAISQSLLGFARGDQSTTANIKKSLAETLSCLSRDLTKDGIALNQEIPDDLTAAINAGQLQQVLMNLIVNARSAMLSQKGIKRLTVKAATTKRGKIVQIEVADTGPGIPDDVLPNIFDPFFSTKQGGLPATESAGDNDAVPRGGTGLGLTICQDIISAAGGTLNAASNPGQGATFTIELPIAQPAPQ